MSSSAAGTSSKPRAASSQPSETSSKRKRGVFQKECKNSCSKFLTFYSTLLSFLIMFLFLVTLVQHMMYGFGDDPNVSVKC